MGYHVTLQSSDIILTKANQPEILQRWKDLNKPENDDLKRGGSYSGGKRTEAWFSWMPPDYDKSVNSIGEILELLGFEIDENEAGDVYLVGYDQKTGQESLFFETIADLVGEGQTAEWAGEDGDLWRWYFDGKTLIEQHGTVSYD